MTLGDRRNKHDRRRGIAIAHVPAVEFVLISLLQDMLCRRASMATDELVSRLSGSLQGWGWVNGAWLSQPTTLTFVGSGYHTLRIQVREDGVQFDHIVLRPTTYLNPPPGPASNDATIVPKP